MGKHIQEAGYIGDFPLGDLIKFVFATHDANDGPASLSIGGGAAMFLVNVTSLVATSLTDELQPNLGAGNNLQQVMIDPAVVTPALDAAGDWIVLCGDHSVGGDSVQFYQVASFSIFKRSALRPSTVGRTLSVDAGGLAQADLSKVSGTTVNASLPQLGVNLVNIGGAAVNTAAAQLGVNVVNLGATAVQQSGGYMKVSAGTGTGQIDLTAGRVGLDWNKVSNPTTVQNLSGTTVKEVTDAATREAAIAAKTGLIPTVPGYGIKKNTGLANFPFTMLSATAPYSPLAGLTVAAFRKLDGGAFAACAGAVTEASGGVYTIDLAAGDTNANAFVTLMFTAAGAKTLTLHLLVTP